MLEPRRLQGELRAPLWNPRHTGYVTPNAVHAFAARARDYAHGCRSCREKTSPLTTPALTQNWPRTGIQRSRLLPPVAPGLSGRANARAAAPHIRAAPHSDALQLQHAHRMPPMYQLRTVIFGETRSHPGEARTEGRDRRASQS
jgi:hypothetical protein